MEYQKIINLLSTTPDKMLRVIIDKWIEVHDQSGNNENRYTPSKQIRFKTSVLRSNLCDFSNAYIIVKGTITVKQGSKNSRKNRPLAFKNNAPFISCISKINNTLIDDAEDLDVVMALYNLLEYSKNQRQATGSLWNYYRDELSDDTNDNISPNKNVVNSECFKYKTSIKRSTYNIDARITNAENNLVNNPAYNDDKSSKKEVEIAVPLNYLSNFWRALRID